MRKLLLALLAMLFIASVTGESISDMKYKVSYVFNSPDTYTDVTTYVDLNVSTWKDSLVLTDGWQHKILVVDDATGKILPHWCEILDNDTVRVWFIKNWTVGDNIVDVYFDSNVLNSTTEEPDKVFIYFTDFNDRGNWSAITLQTVDWNGDGSVDIADTAYYNTYCVYTNNSNLIFLTPIGQKEVIVDTNSNITDTNKVFRIKFHIEPTEKLPYWVDDNGDLWTKVNIPANGTITLRIYKNGTGQPNGSKVFEFFDDFSESSIDTNKWQILGGNWIVSNGYLVWNGESTDSDGVIVSKINFSKDSVVEVKGIRISPESTSGTTEFDQIVMSCSDINNFVLLRARPDAGAIEIYDKSSRSYTLKSSSSIPTTYNVWRVAKSCYNGSAYVYEYMYPNYTLIKTVTWDSPWIRDGYVGIREYPGSEAGDVKYDWFFVRKYAPIEPNVTVTDKGDYWEVKIYNPNNYSLTDFQVEVPGLGLAKNASVDVIQVDAKAISGVAFDLDSNANGYYSGATIEDAKEHILEVERKGNNITAMLDGKIIEQLSDSTYTNGHVGVWTGAFTKPVAYWSFDEEEGEGTVAHDETGNGNDGTIYGATWTTGKYGYALQFDEVDDYVEIPYSETLNVTYSVTYCAWVRPQSNATWQNVVGQIGTDNGIFFYNDRFLGSLWFFNPDGTVGRDFIWDNQSRDYNKWYFVALTYDSSQHVIKLYVNGNLVREVYETRPPLDHTTDFYIGSYGARSFFNGTIDDVRIYNRALSEEEIKALYQTELKYHQIQNITTKVDYYQVYNTATNPLLVITQTSPIATNNDIIVIKNVTFYDETSISSEGAGYELLNNISENLTLIFSGDSVIKKYVITPDNYSPTMSFEAPAGGSLTVIEGGKVRKIYYSIGEDNLSVIWAEPNKATLVEWLIRLAETHDVKITDMADRVITEFKNVQTVDTYVVQGYTYKIYIDNTLKEEKTAIDAELIDYTKPESDIGSLIIVPVTPPMSQPMVVYTTNYDGENITLSYKWIGDAKMLNVSVYDENNTLIYSNAFTAPEQTIKINVGNSSAFWKIKMILVWDGGEKTFNAFIYRPLEGGGFELLKGWKKWVSIAILFLTLVTFSYIHVEAATVATLAMMFFLEIIGFLDWLDYKLKAVLFLMIIIPLALKIKRGW
ncbi:DUF2341 domain-containing protein [Methanocaldococcus sp.]|uniref:DUF2341 domain-containing protein n=1 Tax=Methanocaldococcus sp. TaxID=2152917 RepID=UPI002633B0BE|nr:DUF2341 domain-containing protein [Methanocaldococcus sp.]MCQ6254750.1 DUF2341 domain-containing protein [Methanocaldococcus sp.]